MTRSHGREKLHRKGKNLLTLRPEGNSHHTISDIVMSQWGGKIAA